MRTAIALALTVFVVAACAEYTVHPWTTAASFDLEKVQLVSPANLSRVKEEREDTAILLLAERSHVRLSADQFADFSNNPTTLADGEIAYLVRGVTWFRPPDFSVVALDPAQGGLLYFVQYADTGEVLIPFMTYESVAYPVIAIMRREIAEVRPGAVAGGDGVSRWRSVYGENAWIEPR